MPIGLLVISNLEKSRMSGLLQDAHLQGFMWENKNIIFIDLCALLWSIWLSRNDVVFHNTQKQTVL